jgi:dethiobiotin synthetase
MRGLFVTGTDTGIGKTVVAVALLRSLARAGVRCTGMKPVSAGFDAGGVNADVRAMEDACNVRASLADRNPYAFADAVAPHLAAAASGATIDLATIDAAARRLAASADVLIVEGAGGALVPLDARHDMLDIAVTLGLPVLLVVGLRLGCLNHALLSALAIRRRGLELRGWIANRLNPPMALIDANVDALAAHLGIAAASIDSPAPPPFGADVLQRLGLTGRRPIDPC